MRSGDFTGRCGQGRFAGCSGIASLLDHVREHVRVPVGSGGNAGVIQFDFTAGLHGKSGCNCSSHGMRGNSCDLCHDGNVLKMSAPDDILSFPDRQPAPLPIPGNLLENGNRPVVAFVGSRRMLCGVASDIEAAARMAGQFAGRQTVSAPLEGLVRVWVLPSPSSGGMFGGDDERVVTAWIVRIGSDELPDAEEAEA